MEEKRKEAFCNVYDSHCKMEFFEIKQDVKAIKKALLGELGDEGDSLINREKLNTAHRLWMEGRGAVLVSAIMVAGVGFVGTLMWMVAHVGKGP